MNPFIPLLEANQGTLSMGALVATLALAYMEFRRANKAERARLEEPADAAVDVLTEVLRLVREGLQSEALAHQAVKYAREATDPMNQIR
jgi:hypothetical protein